MCIVVYTKDSNSARTNKKVTNYY